jgi:hypothetical protein
MTPSFKRFAGILVILVMPAVLPAVLTGQEPDKIPEKAAEQTRQDLDASLRADRQAQQETESWAAERTTLEARSRQLDGEVAHLERRLARETTTVDALEAKVVEFERRLVESARLTESLEDTLSVLVERLDLAVARDLPFLPAERKARLAALHLELGDPDSPAAEKLRRVLEAYQVEADFGGTVELVTGAVDVGGEEVRADILRLGRLALFWSTPDRSRVGAWAPAEKAWVELPRGDHRSVLQAMDMAARTRPIEVIGLPLGRIEP